MTAEDKKYNRLAKRATKDKAAAEAFRVEYPDAYRQIGDVAELARTQLVTKIAGEHLLLANAIRQQCGELRAELAGADPTPLERLLADQIALCWLHLHWLEWRVAARDCATIDQADSLERHISGAQRRYLAAIKTLEQVRVLQRPALDVQRFAVIGRQALAQQSTPLAALPN